MCSWTMLIALCTLFVCIAITTGENQETMVSENADSKIKASDDLCLTPACIHSAARILNSMNASVKPCDDFYEFACGNFAKSAVIPREYVALSPFEEAQIKVLSRLQQIIEDIDESTAPKHFRLVKTYYKNCMKNSWPRHDSNLETAVQNLETTANGWPLMTKRDWDNSSFDYSYTISALFSNHFAPDVTNSTVWIAQLQEKSPPLNRNYLKEGFSNEVVQAYYQYMIDIVVAMGIEESEARVSLNETLSLEIELYQVVFAEYEFDSHRRYSKVSLEELNKKYENLPFPKSFTNYDGDEIQIAVDMETMDRVAKWISEKSKSSLANWEAWRSIADEAPTFGDYFAHRTKVFNRIFLGNAEEETNSDKCVSRTQDFLGFALGALYQRKYISQSSINDLILMLDSIKQQFSTFIKKTNWLGPDTKRNALDKVANIKSSLVTCRDFILDDELEIFYRDLELSDGLFEESIRNESKFNEINNPYTSTSNETDRIKCGHFLIESEYLAWFNFIQFGAELHTDFFHDIDRPKYLNYGAAGHTIGQEITKSLNAENRHFDKNGNLKLAWDLKSNQKYNERVQCFIDQYGNYTIDEYDIHVNGYATLNNNLVDNIGIKSAYYAYVDRTKSNDPEKHLPGLDYSPKQMFWIGMANSFCKKYRPEYFKSSIYEEDQSPNKFRVNGPVSNIQEFSNDFKCDPGSRMNPVKKCNLWYDIYEAAFDRKQRLLKLIEQKDILYNYYISKSL